MALSLLIAILVTCDMHRRVGGGGRHREADVVESRGRRDTKIGHLSSALDEDPSRLGSLGSKLSPAWQRAASTQRLSGSGLEDPRASSHLCRHLPPSCARPITCMCASAGDAQQFLGGASEAILRGGAGRGRRPCQSDAS